MLLVTFLIGLVGCVAFFVLLVALQPAEFAVRRSTTMTAPPMTVFDQVNDFRQWDAWSPWEKLDPAMKKIYSGPAAGIGAVREWEGNAKAGKGRSTITESKPAELVGVRLEMMAPFPADNSVTFTFEPQGNQTAVTWTMTGHKNFMMKAFCMFMNMDKMVGTDFEEGLSKLKAIAEAKTGVAIS